MSLPILTMTDVRLSFGGKPLFGQHLACFVLARGIAHLGRAAAHDYDGAMARLLEATQQHDRGEVAYVQRGCCRIETHIAGDNLFLRKRVQCARIGDLVEVAALGKQAQEVGIERGVSHLGCALNSVEGEREVSC